MKRKNSILGIALSFATLYGADTPQAPVMVPDAETGVHIPPDNYYSGANLARLTAEGKRKHAPLMIIIDQENNENPDANFSTSLTGNLAHTLQTALVPTIVSSSIVYNYFVRRKRAGGKDDDWFAPEGNPVSFDKWHLYDVPDSQFFLFVPDHYIKHYKDSLGLNLNTKKLIDISAKLPTGQKDEAIIEYISHKNTTPFSIGNLSTILTTIKEATRTSSQSTKPELKLQAQLPIWDIILHGHGTYGGSIGGLSSQHIQELLTFFDNALPVGVVYIQSCSAGGENLNLLEFDTTISKEKILRYLDYILIVGAITDKPIYSLIGIKNLYSQFYSDAARLQDKGKSLDTLLDNLNDLYRHSGSLHGSSNIPQVWLPGGLGFQTYQINKKVQIIGNVKVRVHEDEQRPIVLPNSTIAALIYTRSIDVPLKVWPHEFEFSSLSSEYSIRKKHWGNIPSVAEILFDYSIFLDSDLRRYGKENYPALTHIVDRTYGGHIVEFMKVYSNAVNLLYPEFISMLRGNDTTQYFNKIEPQPPVGKEKELTGVMHFIRDAFFDIGGRATTKTFLIEELIGNNDISALLELNRLKTEPLSFGDIAELHPLEAKLASSIGKQIKLHKVFIASGRSFGVYVAFVFDDTAWGFGFIPPKDPSAQASPKLTPWNFRELSPASHTFLYESKKGSIPEKMVQNPSVSYFIKSVMR